MKMGDVMMMRMIGSDQESQGERTLTTSLSRDAILFVNSDRSWHQTYGQ
jgi:hypothetical protein